MPGKSGVSRSLGDRKAHPNPEFTLLLPIAFVVALVAGPVVNDPPNPAHVRSALADATTAMTKLSAQLESAEAIAKTGLPLPSELTHLPIILEQVSKTPDSLGAGAGFIVSTEFGRLLTRSAMYTAVISGKRSGLPQDSEQAKQLHGVENLLLTRIVEAAVALSDLEDVILQDVLANQSERMRLDDLLRSCMEPETEEPPKKKSSLSL